MDINEARRRIGQVERVAALRFSQAGRDLRIERTIGWPWKALQRIAEALGTEQIDIADRDPYDTIPSWETINGRYEQEPGCGTCGYGSVLIVRGVLTATANAVELPEP